MRSGFEGISEIPASFLKKGDNPENVEGALTKAQVLILIAVTVIEMDVAQMRSQNLDPFSTVHLREDRDVRHIQTTFETRIINIVQKPT
mgnify:CR=1 FL=1